MLNTKQFARCFSENSRLTQKDILAFMGELNGFIELAIDSQAEIHTSLFELYYSDMKERTTVKIGKNSDGERVTLPKTRKARLRLANKFRVRQKGIIKDILPILKNIAP